MAEDATKPHQHAKGDSAELALTPGICVTVAMEPAKGEQGGDDNQDGQRDSDGYW